MEYFGYTQAINALTGKAVKGFFVVASRWNESREVIEKHPFLTGCMTTDIIIMAVIQEFGNNQACQIGSAIATATELEGGVKLRSLKFNLGKQNLVINDFDPREPLTIKDGKIRFLTENNDGEEIKVGLLDVSNFITARDVNSPQNIPVDLLDINPFPDIEHLAACYPELADVILPKRIFTKPLNEDYSF